MADFNLFQFGPQGRDIYVDASGALQITTDPSASGFIMGYGEAGYALLVDASGRILATDNNAVSGINDLTDVNTAGSTETDVLALSGSTWVPSGVSAGSASLSGLTDTSLSAPASGEILEYNGTNWVNATNAGGGGPTYSSTTIASGASEYIWDVSSGAKQYELIIDNCLPDTDGKRFKVSISDDGGSTYESGATSYFFQRSEDEGTDAYFSDGTTTQPQLFNSGIGNAAGEGGKIMMQVGDCASTDVVSVVSYQGAWINLIGGPLTNRGMFGLGGTAAAITHIKVFWDSGNFRKGDVLLMERS